MEKKGKVSGWQDAKGFGFILPEDGSARVFLHHSALVPDQARPSNGDWVRYSAGIDDKGSVSAKKVWSRSQAEVTRQRRKRVQATERLAKAQSNREKDSLALWIALLFLVGLLVLTVLKVVPFALMAVYAVVSLISFVAYWRDKRAAQQDSWRTSERSLHTLGLLGGWPGALLAQRILRHKSSKAEFRVVFWATVLINVLLLVFATTKLR